MKLNLGIAQMNPTPNVEENLMTIGQLAGKLRDDGAEMAVFPEYCTCLASMATTKKVARSHEEWLALIAPIARACGLALVMGGVSCLAPDGNVYNRTYVLDADGSLLAFYDKRHLFALKFNRQGYISETEAFVPGHDIKTFRFKEFHI